MSSRATQPGCFFLLLAAIFIVRGIAIQGLYPPLEGFDEYQHIAVIHYIVENRALPVYGHAMVPVSLYDDIVANPHPNHSADQTRPIGAQSYDTFYAGKPFRTADVPIKLYQAQHPPLYYIIMAPLYAWSRSVLNFRSTVYLLRFVNLVAASFAIVLWLFPLRYILADERLYRFFALAVAASPMYMIHISRVANDAFAHVFAGIAVMLAMRVGGISRPYMKACIAGVVTGISVMFKLTGLVLLPAVPAYFVILAVASRTSLRRSGLCCCAFLAGYLLMSFPYHAWVQDQYGTFLFDQLSYKCQASGFTLLDLVMCMRLDHVKNVLAKGILLDNLWTSGWSTLAMPSFFKRVYGILLLMAAGGLFAWLQASLRNENTRHIREWCPLILCLLLTCAMAGAYYLYALKLLAVANVVTVPSYYVMAAYPALLSCFFVAALGYGRRMASVIVLLLLLLFTWTELYALCFVAVPHWAQSQDLTVIFARLASLHPVFPSPIVFFILYPVALVLLIAALLPALHSLRAQTRDDP